MCSCFVITRQEEEEDGVCKENKNPTNDVGNKKSSREREPNIAQGFRESSFGESEGFKKDTKARSHTCAPRASPKSNSKELKS